jgi:hypothetical protein
VPFHQVRPIWTDRSVPHLRGIFHFEGLVGSVPSLNRTQELVLGTEPTRPIPPNSRTEHILNNLGPTHCHAGF